MIGSWELLAYIVGILFNMGFVSVARSEAIVKGRKFLSSGRFAVILVFLLSFVELLIAGKFAALENGAAFVDLLQQAATFAMATVGTHAVGSTAIRATIDQ